MSPDRPPGRTPIRSRRRDLWRGLRRTVRTRRRLLAASCTALAVTAGLQAVRPPAPPTTSVVVAAHDLDSGATLTSGDLAVADLPPDAVPDGAYETEQDVAGRSVAAPMRSGEPVTDYRLLRPGLLDGYPAGSALSAVRIADRAALTGIRVGDEVDVIGVDPRAEREPTVLARGVPVVALPTPDSEHDDGAVALLATPEPVALDLADAAVRRRLSVVSIG